MAPVNFTLLVGAGLSVLAGLLHVAIIIGGPAWYRVVHAGARVIDSAVRGSWYAPVITLAIARAIGLGRICAVRRRCTAPTPVVAGVASVVSAIAI
jgi:hypothetical protein